MLRASLLAVLQDLSGNRVVSKSESAESMVFAGEASKEVTVAPKEVMVDNKEVMVDNKVIQPSTLV